MKREEQQNFIMVKDVCDTKYVSRKASYSLRTMAGNIGNSHSHETARNYNNRKHRGVVHISGWIKELCWNKRLQPRQIYL